MGSTAVVTGQQRMLTPPWHLMLPLVFPGVRVSLIFTVKYILPDLDSPMLTADFSVYWLDSPILTAEVPFCSPTVETEFDY
jgi:hypothetical protein